MLKNTYLFNHPSYLSTKLEQIVIEKPSSAGESQKKTEKQTRPIEDTGILILDSQQITITHALLSKLVANNTAVVTCDEKHLPNGLFMPLNGHTLLSKNFSAQIQSSQPLKKQLWQQTIIAKITNQAYVLEYLNKPAQRLNKLAQKVKSGDPENCEGQAAAYYWPRVFETPPIDANSFYIESWIRDRDGDEPNNLLNYGYAILRAIVARSIIGAGLLPVVGIHHRNQYNAYCLADDLMEPYRPFVDLLVHELWRSEIDLSVLTPDLKRRLLALATLDTKIDGKISPLFTAVQKTAYSAAKCFLGESRKIAYPSFL